MNDEQERLDAFIKRAGFSYGWMNLESWARRMAEKAVEEQAKPIDMILHCPSCHVQHVDASEDCEDEGCDHYGTPHTHVGAWDNPPHRSHLCAECGYTWRPADVCTNGVATILTKGKNDS